MPPEVGVTDNVISSLWGTCLTILLWINIYDINGGEVIELFNNYKYAGTYSINWNGENERGVKVSAGVYLYSIDVGEFWQTKKMILLK